MTIDVREAELPAEREILLDTLVRNRDHGDMALRRQRFQWSHSTNPYGTPRAWLAVDRASGRVIGATTAFPRQVLVHGRATLGWNGGDTSIDREFRTLGPAVKLRRAVKQCVDRGEMAFLYSFPVDRMRAVLEQIGHVVIGELARHGIVVRIDRFLGRATGRPKLARCLAGMTNPFLSMWPGNWRRGGEFEVVVENRRRFDRQYDDLFERVAARHPVITVRDARFLNWRFADNPLHAGALTFSLNGGGRLCGYAIVDVNEDRARVIDFLVDGSAETQYALWSRVTGWLRRRGVCTLTMHATEREPAMRILRSFGPAFRDGTNASITVHTRGEGPCGALLDEQNWFMTQADRDV